MELSPGSGRSPGSSRSDLLNQYHRLAADTLLGTECRTDSAVLEAAEDGQLARLQSLLSNSPSSLNARCPSSGDTPLIVAAREGHEDVVEVLLMHGADVTVQNDADETVLDVASERMRKRILDNIYHEDRAMSNAQALLHSAWLGDAVSVRRSLDSGKNYLNVNCRNTDGNSPLLLVTRDIALFDKVQSAMETDYDPITVMQDLIKNHADVNTCDKKGRSALHLVASSESVHARKMISLLLRNGSSVEAQDDEAYAPLHVASSSGHRSIIVALVEEGGADVNTRGGVRGDTPLMLSARGGYNEAAEYLISQGADVTVIDEKGDTALTVAKTPSMVKLLKEAWVEQTQSDHSLDHSPSHSPPNSPPHDPSPTTTTQSGHPSFKSPSIILTKPSLTSLSLEEVNTRGLDMTPTSPPEKEINMGGSDLSPTSPQLAEEDKFFLTEGKIRRKSEEEEETDYPDSPRRRTLKQTPHTPSVSASASEAEADDELEAGHESRRVKPATRRAYIRGILNKRNAEREAREVQASKTGSLTQVLLNTEDEVVTYSSADEGSHRHPIRTAKLIRGRSRDDGKSVSWQKKVGGRRPSRLALQRSNDPSLSRSYDCLVGENSSMASPKLENRMSPLLPNVIKSPGKGVVSPLSKTTSQHKAPSQLSAHLPSLSNMHAVAMVTVDTDREKLRVQRYGRGTERGIRKNQDQLTVGGGGAKSAKEKVQGSPGTFQRSNSLTKKPISHQEISLIFNHKKRNSTGSVAFAKAAESKVPLLPNVVTSQFGFGIQGGGGLKPEGGAWSHATPEKSKGRGRYSKLLSPTSPLGKVAPRLSVLNEIAEDKTLTKTGSYAQQSMGSKDSSTLKSSDFEVDSLEQEVVLFSTNSSARTSPHHPQTKGEGTLMNGTMAESREPRFLLPPAPLNRNLVVNYADPHGSTPLSPIWNQLEYFRMESDNSTNSEYITSYIGKLTPLPSVLSPDFNNKTSGPQTAPGPQIAPGPPGPGGNSSDSDRQTASSGESGEEGGAEAKDGCLKWKRGRLLGKGAYGKVWEGLLSSARMIAVKEVELDTDSLERAQSQYEKIQGEVGILRSMKHRNIVSYLGTSMHMATVYIFMQYISGGSLQSIIKRFGPLDGDTVRHYTIQIINALCYLHQNGIIHRDIKGANIMVNSRGVVKLIDFGCAKNCEDMASNMHSVRGTPYWMAPEVICGYGYGRRSDIWSLGCTVLEMATTKPPWADYPPEAAMFQIGMGKPIPPLPDHLPKALTDFFYLCLTREQGERPGACELLQHKFLHT